MERSAAADCVVAVVLLLAGARVVHAQPAVERVITDVYRTVLADARCSGRGPGSRGFVPVIRRELRSAASEPWWSTVGPDSSFADRARALLPPRLLDEMTKTSEGTLSPSTANALGVQAIAQSEADALARTGDFWMAFYQKFPSASAHVQLSRVALDMSSGEALMYCGYGKSPFGGEGFLVHLHQMNGVWAAIAWHRVWVS